MYAGDAGDTGSLQVVQWREGGCIKLYVIRDEDKGRKAAIGISHPAMSATAVKSIDNGM